MRFNLDMPAWKWPFYIMRHPFEGFEDLRWKKAYNMKVALVIVLKDLRICVGRKRTTQRFQW